MAVALKKTGGGVVSFCLRRPRGKSSRASFTPSQLIAVVQTGLPIEELKDLQASLQMPMEQLVPLLGISKATLHRRKTGGRLGAAESDRVVRFARLMGQAVEVMESTAGARHWLNSPQFGLGGAVPLAYAGTEIGAREVEDLLGRIEHGVYS
ncbi:MAG TPA: antitoxin Xre/MbcA/ParS toxin-binding domain-containing protein [Candidatus Saccharimonadales bacterium]|nr:antitoxin Xre/MbcA/ParS toxin-binding domain-containing protein [Candidatus Saccharimonadales bacterium]